MEVTLLRAVAAVVPILGLGALVLLGLWALTGLPAVRSRSDAGIAVAFAGLGGLAVSGFIAIVAVGFAFMDVGEPGPEAYVAVLPVVLPIGIGLALSAIAGYAALARTHLAGVALIGVILGPAVLVGLTLGAQGVAGIANTAASGIEERQAAVDVADRSKVLRLMVRDIHLTTSQGGSVVTAVRLRATVHAEREVRLETAGKITWPQFEFLVPGGAILGSPTPAGPSIFAAGSDTTYELSFEETQTYLWQPPGVHLAATYQPPAPGTWVLQMRLRDEAGLDYEVKVDVVIAPGPAAQTTRPAADRRPGRSQRCALMLAS